MNVQDIFVFLLCQSVLVSAAALLDAARRVRPTGLVVAVLALGSVALAAYFGVKSMEGDRNLVEQLILDWRARRPRTVLAGLLGLGVAVPWVAALRPRRPRAAVAGAAAATAAEWPRDLALGLGLLLTTGAATAFGWNELYRDYHGLRCHVPGFAIDEVASFTYDPIRLAIGADDRIFVSADRADNGFDLGLIYEVEPDPEPGRDPVRLVAEAPYLFRPYGLTARDGRLYVSRSGHHARLVRGKVEYVPAGAVTELRDLDGDGYFEYADDLLGDLPGSTGPDPQHQNNGLLFGPDGSLYITQGNPADRAPPAMPWEGKVLRLPPGGGEPEVFARGFRNPFSLVFGPDGALFGVDNDINANPGDEVNHVLRGAHYGHPFAIPDGRTRQEGFRDPVFLGPPESHLCGLAYSESLALPEPVRGSLLVTDIHQSRVLWLRLERQGDTYRTAEHGVFAGVRTPVDVAVRSNGDIFVLSRFTRKLFRFRPAVPAAPARTGSRTRPER